MSMMMVVMMVAASECDCEKGADGEDEKLLHCFVSLLKLPFGFHNRNNNVPCFC